MRIYKISKAENKVLALAIILVLAAILVAQATVLADNEATQSASTSAASTVLIRNIADDADVATITFPAGAPSAAISNPTGNTDVQVLTATASEAAPVALLTSTASYTLWYNVTDTSAWSDTVASEKIYTVAIAAELDLTTFGSSADEITVWDTDQETTQALVANTDEELYLQVTLSASSGKSGTSTLTVLGES